ncbi:hypothetical protein DFJ74DRAFT_364305 [Hyaloraphidium curvatum]|nr:hypothetical protein DFJ74DRAFT_364305 [Hyaloraphidium curvatum]
MGRLGVADTLAAGQAPTGLGALPRPDTSDLGIKRPPDSSFPLEMPRLRKSLDGKVTMAAVGLCVLLDIAALVFIAMAGAGPLTNSSLYWGKYVGARVCKRPTEFRCFWSCLILTSSLHLSPLNDPSFFSHLPALCSVSRSSLPSTRELRRPRT